MKPDKLYFFALCIVYSLFLMLGNLDDLSTSGQWRAQAAAWLGEPPAGLQAEIVRASADRMYPTLVFSLPADAGLQQKIIDTYRLEKAGTTAAGGQKYGNKHVLPDYTDDTRPQLQGLSVFISPWLEVEPDGSMRFCADDGNVEQGAYHWWRSPIRNTCRGVGGRWCSAPLRWLPCALSFRLRSAAWGGCGCSVVP